MEARFFLDRIGGVNRVKITTKFSLDEEKLIKRFGDPEVQVGGDFGDFILEEKLRKLKSGFPYIQEFSSEDLGDELAFSHGKTYEAEMEIRLKDTIDALRARQDDFVGERVVTL